MYHDRSTRRGLRWWCLLSTACGLLLGGCPPKPPKSPATGPASAPAEPPAAKREASPDGWRWDNPRPSGNSALALWGKSLDDFYAVGDSGAIFRYVEGELSAIESGTNALLSGVWGDGAGALFVVGEQGTILRSRGGAFKPEDSGTRARLWSVWGSSARDVYAVGEGGVILHYDGLTWAPQESGTTATLTAIVGRSARDIYAVGEAGTILRYDGVSWSAAASGTEEGLLAVAVVGPKVVAAGGGGALLTSQDGLTFTAEKLGTKDPFLVVFGEGKEILALGPRVAASYDGEKWTVGTFNSDPPLAVLSIGEGLILSTATGRIVKSEGGDLVELTWGVRDQLNDASFNGSSGTVASEAGLLEFDGGEWTVVPSTAGGFFEGVSGAGDGAIAVGPAGLVVTRAAGSWGIEPCGSEAWLTDVYRASKDVAYAVGHHGTFLARDAAGSWKTIPTPTSYAFLGVDGEGPGSVLLVGESGTIYRYDGKALAPEDAPTTADLKAVSVFPGGAFAVGKKGTILRRDGGKWVREESGTAGDLYSVVALSADEAYAVGDKGRILHRTTAGWKELRSGTALPLFGVAAGADGVVAVGAGGAILRRPLASKR